MPTIYVLTYEISGDRYVSVFATAEEREACAWNVIASLAKDGGLDSADVPRGDLHEAWDYVRSDDVDGMWLDSDEMTDAVAAASPSVAPPSDAPAPLNARMLALLKSLEWSAQVDDEHGSGYEDGCPHCGQAQRHGHDQECELADLISEAEHDAPAPVDPVKAEMLAALKRLTVFRPYLEKHMDADDIAAWREAADVVARVEGRA